MVTRRNPKLEMAERQIEDRIQNLIQEFKHHYEEYVQQHPAKAATKRVVFESWAIQKIAGLQLCVEHIAEQFNRHVEKAPGTDVPDDQPDG